MTMTVIQTIMICISCLFVAANSSGDEVIADSNSFQAASEFQTAMSQSEKSFSNEKPRGLLKQSYLQSRRNSAVPKSKTKEELIKEWLPVLMAMLLIAILCYIFMFLGKSGLSSLYSGYLQIRMLIFILLLTTGVNILCYYWIYTDSLRHSQIIAARLYILPLAIFIAGVLFSRVLYFLMAKYNLRYLKMNGTKPRQEIYNLVNQLAYDLSVKSKVTVVHSDLFNVSPYVVGTSSECCIILPANYEELLEDTCETNKIKESLNRLVLSHELAHIKNGDADILSLYWAIAKPFKWFCVIAIISHFLIRVFIASSSVTVLYSKDLIFFDLSVLCILYISLRYILRKRERLADAVATQMINPEIMRKLTHESKDALSPLETYIFSLTSKSPLNRFCFGYAFSKDGWIWNLKIFKKKVSDFRLAYLNRIRSYLSKDVLLYGFGVTLKDILFIAAIIAVIFSSAKFIKLGLIAHHLISFDAPPENIRSGILFDKSLGIDRFYMTGINWFLRITLSVVIAGYLLMLHKDPSGQNKKDMMTLYIEGFYQKLKKNRFFALKPFEVIFSGILLLSNKFSPVYYLIVFYICFNILISLIPNFSWGLLHFTWMDIQPPGIFINLLILTLLYIFTRINFERCYYPCTKIHVKSLFKINMDVKKFELVLQYLLWGAITIIFIAIEPAMHVLTKLAVSCLALGLCLFIFDYTTMKIFFRHYFIEQESVIYQRFFWRKVYLPLCVTTRKGLNANVIKGVLFHRMFYFIVPLCLILFAGYLILLKYDLWYFNHADEFREAYWKWYIGDAKYDPFMGMFLILYNRVPPGFGLASSLISLFLLLLMLIVQIIFCIIILPLIERKKKVLAKVKQQVLLDKLIKLDVHSQSKEQRYIVEMIVPKISLNHPYIYGHDKTPLMTSTCDAVLILHRQRRNVQKMQQMADWVKSCMSHDGGFSAQQGIAPDILHTHAALSMLNEIGQLDSLLKQQHRNWLKIQLQKLMGYECRDLTDMDWLFYARDIVLGLSLVASEIFTSKEESERIIREAYWKWQQNKQSALFTMLFVSILKTSDSSNTAYDDEILTWLHNNERKLPGLSVKSQLSEIVQYVTILSQFYPQEYLDRESVIQVRDNLSKLNNNG